MSWVFWGSLFMFLGVALGAFGAHGLKDALTAEAKQTYQTAVLYHLVHGLALLAVGWLAMLRPMESLVRTAGWAFIFGIILFSGSLYLFSVTGVKKLGIITPFGGLAFLIGWLCLALAAKR
ncbi:MAG: hypothetical protein COV75_01170 [Candidatus Omnitrophica bacterium CG11_big_fil_rev_8_21_14_0_20_63_9]|nr:MAG: hypothetical protein COV75_01170 [Candidatus Omnitrophica bacterium CG11_big_fil_rev_8_21_14_0_20_63_9]